MMLKAGIDFIKQLYAHIMKDDCPGLAAEIAYHMMLASGPILIFLITLFGLLGQQEELLADMLYYSRVLIPPPAAGVVEGLLIKIVRSSSGGIAIISFLAAIWAASNGAVVILKALNRAYDYSDEDGGQLSYLQTKLLSLLIVLFLGVAFFIGSTLIIVGNLLLNFLAGVLHISQWSILFANIIRWGLVIFSITLFSTFVYSIAPGPQGNRYPIKHTVFGSLVFVTLWLLSSYFFSLYVENMGRYNEVYGVLGAVIVLMIWLYIAALSFLIGGEINAVLEKRAVMGHLAA